MNNSNNNTQGQTNGNNTQNQTTTTNQSTTANNSGYAVIGQDGMTDLYRVAKKYGTSVQSLMRLNGIADSNKVRNGQKILVK